MTRFYEAVPRESTVRRVVSNPERPDGAGCPWTEKFRAGHGVRSRVPYTCTP